MASMRKAVAPTVERILELASDAGLTEARQHDFSVALSEALSNAAVHGNRLYPTRAVAIRVEVEPGRRVVVDIEDAGTGFDVAAIGDPTGDQNQILKPNGRGLFLMKQLVDRVDFNDEGNHVRLTMEKRS
jgi:serine/threonine-protein kinase RsbW